MNDPWFSFVLGALATWRVTHLLVHEDGPWDAVLRLRGALGNGFWGHLLDCFYCLSIWIAAPFAFAVAHDPAAWGLAWIGLSGAACLLQRLTPDPSAVIQPLNIEGDHHELLRTTTGGDDADHFSADAGRAGTDTHPPGDPAR